MKRKHSLPCLFLISTLVLSTGCVSLNSRQKSEFQAMKAADLHVEEKSPGTAIALGFLPGGGSFYTRQWGLGILDLLLWPFSILWDPIAGYEAALVINYDESKHHAKRNLQKEMNALDERVERKEITDEQYRRERKKIEQKHTFD